MLIVTVAPEGADMNVGDFYGIAEANALAGGKSKAAWLQAEAVTTN
jgi:hypothetical protein